MPKSRVERYSCQRGCQLRFNTIKQRTNHYRNNHVNFCNTTSSQVVDNVDDIVDDIVDDVVDIYEDNCKYSIS